MPSFIDIPWVAATFFVIDWLIRISLCVRVIMRRRPVGVSLSWLSVILLVPLLGAFVYLAMGENRVGRLRNERFAHIRPTLEALVERLGEHATAETATLSPSQRALVHHSTNRYGLPLLRGNALELLHDTDAVFDRLIADINQAQRSVHMQFYIWSAQGRVSEVIDALIAAQQRGVTCLVLADAVGSKAFQRSGACRRLRAAGVRVVAMLPVGWWRMLFRRQDLRNHRKIAVIDGAVGYTGSLNMADPAFFKRDTGVGRWRDAMVRVTGPVVSTLGMVFLSDFDIETEERFGDFETVGGLRRLEPTGRVVAQLLPSGPGFARDAIRETLMTAIFGAEEELVLTTPYFVPDEPVLEALISAAKRGVTVTLIVPEQVDSLMVRLASRSLYGDLLDAGIRVMLFRNGLLHTKTLVADRRTAMIGTVNLDMRSLWLNFEVTLAVYDAGFASELQQLQERYLSDSVELDAQALADRPFHTRLVENTARLIGPLL